jgi:hypothetical protein
MRRLLVLSLCAVSVLAVQSRQASAQQRDILWPTFGLDLGAYQLTTDQKMRVDGTGNRPGTEVDWSRELLPDSETLWTVDGEWLFADRHSVSLRYQHSSRDASRSISRQISIGDTVFPVGARVSAETSVTTYDSAYTYWWVKNSSFGLGPSLGLIYAQFEAKASASVQAGGTGQAVERSRSVSTDLPVPMVGFAMKGTPIDRLVLYGEGLYLPSVTIGDYTGQASTYGVGAEYFLYGPWALGLSYDATAYSVKLDKNDWQGKLRMNSDGWRLFVHAGF